MTKTHLALVVAIDNLVEDAISLLIDGVSLKCFVSYCPSKIEVGKIYEVEIDMVLPDEEYVSETDNEQLKAEMIGSGFSCEIYGYLDGEVFRSFVDFMDQDIHYEYPHLNEHYIKITAQRIDVSFTSTSSAAESSSSNGN